MSRTDKVIASAIVFVTAAGVVAALLHEYHVALAALLMVALAAWIHLGLAARLVREQSRTINQLSSRIAASEQLATTRSREVVETLATQGSTQAIQGNQLLSVEKQARNLSRTVDGLSTHMMTRESELREEFLERVKECEENVQTAVRREIRRIRSVLEQGQLDATRRVRRDVASFSRERALADKRLLDWARERAREFEFTAETRHRVAVAHRDSAQDLLVDVLEAIRSSNSWMVASQKREIAEATEPSISALIAESAEASATRQRKETVKLIDAVRSETQQVEALLQLYADFRPRFQMPSLGGWALDARSLLHIQSLVKERRPRRILELGSGTSTIWLGYMSSRYDFEVVTIDHLAEYRDRTADMLRRHGVAERVDLRLGALEDQVVADESYRWYARHSYADLEGIDMLIVDGPPKASGPLARFPALPLLQARLSRVAVVLLDDSDRPDELRTLERWRMLYPNLTIADPGISRLAVLETSVTEGGQL